MENYEEKVKRDLERWRKGMMKRPSKIGRISKKVQQDFAELIPEKGHLFITESIKRMVETTLTGVISSVKTNENLFSLSFEQKEEMVKHKLKQYRRTAVVEGAGTGAGGLFLGIADFPLLLSIKMKFLFETANIYGYDVRSYEERLFILYLFQLAFSSDQRRKEVYKIIESWQVEKEKVLEMDWRIFQQEYRDYLDLAKLLQLVPGIGAIVGAFANYHLLDQLGEVAMNGYRLRYLNNN